MSNNSAWLRNKFTWGRFFLVLALSICIGPALFLASVFWPAREVRAVEHELKDYFASSPRHKVRFNVGFLPITLARFGLSFAPIPPEIKPLTSSVKSASIGYYQFAKGMKREAMEDAWARLDQRLEKFGWCRIVGISYGYEKVRVFCPKESGLSPAHVPILAVVLHEDNLVVARVTGNLEPVYEYAMKQMPQGRFFAMKDTSGL